MRSNYKNRLQLKTTSNILLAVILIYPILFSFSHALTHHLESHKHSTHNCSHSKTYNSPTNSWEVELLNPAIEECPICNYEFSFAIENKNQLQNSINLNAVSLNIPLSEIIFISEICKISAPRAPPTC